MPRRLPCPVAGGSGSATAEIAVGVADIDKLGRRVAVAISIPTGSLIAMLDATEVEVLRDELQRAEAELLSLSAIKPGADR